MGTGTATPARKTGTPRDADLLDNAGMDGEYLTVAEAAARLEIGEKRLRRWLARPGNEGLTLASVRMRKTGPVNVAVLPADLLDRIASELHVGVDGTSSTAGGATQTTGTESGQKRQKAGTPNADGIVLEMLQARVADLQSALESERQNTARLADSLGLVRDVLRDTQEEVRQLRALSAPPAKQARRWPWQRGE